MSTFCEQELVLKNFGCHHKRPAIFVTSQFGPHVLYPAWLTIQLLYHLIVLVIDGYQTAEHDGEPTGNYFLYLTNWAYLLLVVSNVIDLSITLYVQGLAKYILEERETDRADAEIIMRNRAVKISYKTMGKFYKMRGYLKISWIFFTMSTVVGITVTFLEGTLRLLSAGLDLKYNLLGSCIGEDTLDFGTLAFTYFNTIVIIIHIIISAKPFRLFHVYMPVAFVAIYMVFSIIYQKARDICDNSIYKILNWDEVFRTTGIAYGVVFIVVPLIHLLVFGLVQIRIKVGTWFRIRYSFSKWKKTKIKPAEPEVDPNTNVMRWLESNSSERSKSKGIDTDEKRAYRSGIAGVVASSSRATSPRVETTSAKSETSL